MSTHKVLFASTIVLLAAAAASAQPVVVKPEPGEVRVFEPTSPFPIVTVPVPPVAFPPVEFPPVAFPPVPAFPAVPDMKEVERIAMLAAQGVTVNKGEPFRLAFAEPNSPDRYYSQARSYIDRDQYDRAIDPLDKVIGAKGDRADAAMYWKAYSQLKLARRDEALSTLSQMQKQYPTSKWLGDARALEVEIKQAAGQPVSADAMNDDLKLLALQGILRTDPEAAFPVVEKMLMGGASVRVKERALFVLGQNRSERAQQIIGNVAKGTSNPDLQLTAIRTLGMSNSPDAINTLTAVYRGDSSVDVKKAVISALATSRNAAATTSLVALARAERNPELKTLLYRHLSNSSNAEAKALMLETIK
jgi:tetratricopeptide (TPR) repeat protein